MNAAVLLNLDLYLFRALLIAGMNFCWRGVLLSNFIYAQSREICIGVIQGCLKVALHLTPGIAATTL